jgi:hypothetical protein
MQNHPTQARRQLGSIPRHIPLLATEKWSCDLSERLISSGETL